MVSPAILQWLAAEEEKRSHPHCAINMKGR
jgi:hypothetical protein